MLRCKNEENIRKNEDFLRFNGQFCWIKKLPDKIIRKNEDFSRFFEIFPVFAVLTLLPNPQCSVKMAHPGVQISFEY